ncbi:MAG: hypothetical protein NTZ16_03460 [Verrucomicrobia bacterium]|nr:hypothetical protein [Verrucomicrobiota bacterium]
MNRLTAIALIMGSCLFFGCSPSTRKLINEYSLERFNENEQYYVVTPDDEPGGGVFDGTIHEIGWNQDWILALVTRLSHGDKSGWYALNLKTKQIVGPIEDSEMKTNSAYSKIQCHDSAAVFSGRTATDVHK